jgi:hypothetical protein
MTVAGRPPVRFVVVVIREDGIAVTVAASVTWSAGIVGHSSPVGLSSGTWWMNRPAIWSQNAA